jgi:hypothetical protein
MKFKTIWITVTALLLTACATAPQTESESASQAESLQWKFAGYTAYEDRQPGLGSSQKYRSSLGWVDVYSYGLRRANWAAGVADPAFAAHFQSTVDDVRQTAQGGDYSDLEVGAVRDVEIAGQTFRTVTFKLAVKGAPVKSMTFLTALNGKLLKYRMTFFPAGADDLDSIARRFIEENLRAQASRRTARA